MDHVVIMCKRCSASHIFSKDIILVGEINSCFHCYTEFEMDIRNKILVKLKKLGEERISDICLVSDVVSVKITNC